MDNAVKESKWIAGYYKYKVYANGIVVPEGALIPEQCLNMIGVWVETNLGPKLFEIPNNIFANRKQIWSWAQRVQLAVNRGSSNPHASRSSRSISSGD